ARGGSMARKLIVTLLAAALPLAAVPVATASELDVTAETSLAIDTGSTAEETTTFSTTTQFFEMFFPESESVDTQETPPPDSTFIPEADPESATVEATVTPAEDAPLTFEEFRVPDAVATDITAEWYDELINSHEWLTWAPMEFHPTDSQLDRMGLPSAEILSRQRYPEPTMITKSGETEDVDIDPVNQETGTLGPTAPPFAGAGWFGIRPGAKVLLLNGGSIGWCTLAHVYGSPGNYSISTAGHCGKTGDTATLIAAFGNRAGVLNPVLLDFGTFKTSHDGGLGNDWALISIKSEFQSLVSPTMAFWGGPRGMYTPTGQLVGITFPRRGLVPQVELSTDPTLAQVIVHYGHGTGIGTGGTPRGGTAIYWGTTHFMFEGLLSPGDSGSGSNALVGDTVGGSMEAAGINTHIWVDPLMRSGIGIMAGTRATQVSGTLANGQIVPYPVPVTGAP
ncbi:MAG: hypothetical protein ACRDQ2_18165, partial [Gaiellales bacterium]